MPSRQRGAIFGDVGGGPADTIVIHLGGHLDTSKNLVISAMI